MKDIIENNIEQLLNFTDSKFKNEILKIDIQYILYTIKLFISYIDDKNETKLKTLVKMIKYIKLKKNKSIENIIKDRLFYMLFYLQRKEDKFLNKMSTNPFNSLIGNMYNDDPNNSLIYHYAINTIEVILNSLGKYIQ